MDALTLASVTQSVYERVRVRECVSVRRATRSRINSLQRAGLNDKTIAKGASTHSHTHKIELTHSRTNILHSGINYMYIMLYFMLCDRRRTAAPPLIDTKAEFCSRVAAAVESA